MKPRTRNISPCVVEAPKPIDSWTYRMMADMPMYISPREYFPMMMWPRPQRPGTPAIRPAASAAYSFAPSFLGGRLPSIEGIAAPQLSHTVSLNGLLCPQLGHRRVAELSAGLSLPFSSMSMAVEIRAPQR